MLTVARTLVAAFLLVPTVGLGQSRPDFSGTWTQIEPALGPNSTHVERLELRDSGLKVTVETSGTGMGLGYSGHLDHTYSIGAPAETKKDPDGTIRSIAVAWDGPSLVFTRTTQEGANTTTERTVWSLSDDGTTLTKASETTSWRGTTSATTVFKRR